MADKAEICRTRAEHYRQQAARTVCPIDKQQLLRLSEEWLRIAQTSTLGPSSEQLAVGEDRKPRAGAALNPEPAALAP